MAAEGYDVQLTADYLITEDKPTAVELNYKLINTTATTFVESYRIALPMTGVSEMVLQQQDEEIEKTQTEENGENVFDLKFLNEVVGQGKARQFSVEYADSSLVQARGKNVVVRLPVVGVAEDYQKYTVTVTAPTSFGELATATPEPTKTTNKAGQVVYTFNLETPQEIILQYGQEQISQFAIELNLENQSNSATYRQIRLPLGDAQQEFVYAFLTPEPDYYQEREDGWWLYYLLRAWEKKTVQAQGYVRAEQVDSNYTVETAVPEEILPFWQSFFVEEMPVEFSEDLEATPEVQIKLDKWWVMPLPGHYSVEIYNRTGKEIDNLQLRAQTNEAGLTVTPTTAAVTLWPWQKTVVPVHLARQNWWPIYQEADLQLSLWQASESGEIIINEKNQAGITLAYQTLAAIGGVLAAAITGWSLLVARRK